MRAVALLLLLASSVALGQPLPAAPASGDAAPAEVVVELQRTLDVALRQFHGMDLEGVLTHVSERYRTGPLTKPALRQQLVAIFAAHDALTARVRIDEVRMIGDRAWVYSTGDVTGRLRFIGTPVVLFSWERSPEVAWRETGRWRLIGDQQG